MSTSAIAQNSRISDPNAVGWYNGFLTLNLNSKWSLLGEYQWRRDNIIIDWKQGMYRTGINYQLTPTVQLRAGYAFVETYPYGAIPIQAAGRYIPEHRTYQMITLTDTVKKLELSHRYMLEQRWVGRYSNPNATMADEFVFMNRFRYMLRGQYAFNKPHVSAGAFYAAALNELFIGFGPNVNINVFDQNRISIVLGYQFSRQIRLEAGYINQILQLGRLVDSRHVFQYNNGVIVNANVTLDLQRP